MLKCFSFSEGFEQNLYFLEMGNYLYVVGIDKPNQVPVLSPSPVLKFLTSDSSARFLSFLTSFNQEFAGRIPLQTDFRNIGESFMFLRKKVNNLSILIN